MTPPHREVAIERAQAQLRALLHDLHEAGVDAHATLMIGDRRHGVRVLDAGPNWAIFEGTGPQSGTVAYAHDVLERVA